MKKILVWIFLCLIIIFHLSGKTIKSPLWGDLTPGLHPVGFKLMTATDQSRVFHSNPQFRGLPSGAETARQIRIYLWYPSKNSTRETLRLETFMRMAAGDFDLLPAGKTAENGSLLLTVQLQKGVPAEKLQQLLLHPTAAVENAEPLNGRFPLIVIGQGLYYESPLTQLVLAEYLASHGYVVATCPLLGTYCRLVNLNMVDLETQVRDMEFVISQVRTLPFVDRRQLALVGYDLGGMAGLLLCMRNPEIAAFLSLDSGILKPHFSGLPQVSPHYQEARFVIPWMHMTQARFVSTSETQAKTLWHRKLYGDSYLLPLNTSSHGDFTSYAMWGMENPVNGYWGPPQKNSALIHETLCRYSLNFFDAYVKKDPQALAFLDPENKEKSLGEVLPVLQHRQGKPAPLLADDFYDDIIRHGTLAALPQLKQKGISSQDTGTIDEKSLNWMGYHFLYWWGRENEALELFQFVCDLFPGSANACDSLGEAYLVLGNREKAVECYRKVLELDPQNKAAMDMLQRLGEK